MNKKKEEISMKHLITTLGLIGTLTAPQLANAQETNTETAIFAAGCFWCIEKDMEKVNGVLDVVSGYTGGENTNPTYQYHPGHYEAVKVTYNPATVSYQQLLTVFWNNHDPFDAKGQFCDKGSAYKAALFPLNEQQKTAAEQSLAEAQDDFTMKIVTPVLGAKPFYLAEGYHQDYYKKNPIKYKFYRWNCGRDQRLEEIAEARK